MYVFDDNDPQAREGTYRYTLQGRHENSRVNYVDFWPEQKCTATASDDGYVNIQNHQNQKQEGALCPFNEGPLPEVKLCKFLKSHNCLVSSDMDGYLNFYAVVPSPFKNQLLCRKRFYNELEQISANMHDEEGNQVAASQKDSKIHVVCQEEPVYFPIRGMDFNPKTGMLYTGDEAGYL